MTKKTLLLISGIADSFDLAFGWIIGPWTIIVDAPITIIHFLYAGPRALLVLSEYAPVFGVLPIYTIMALSYDEDKSSVAPITASDAGSNSHPAQTLISDGIESSQTVYIQVDGQQSIAMPMKQAIHLYRSGQIKKYTLWWHEGMTDWEPMHLSLK